MLQDAENYLKKAIDIDPHISSYHGNLGEHMPLRYFNYSITTGVLYHRMGQYQLAERSYNNALRRDPHNELAKQNLQKLGNRLGKPNK